MENTRAPKKQLPERLREALRRQVYAPLAVEERGKESHSVERRMLENILDGCDLVGPSTSRDLVGELGSRLRRLETALRTLRSTVAAKDRDMLDLRAENERLRSALTSDVAATVREQEAEVCSLRRQVRDMETFLADYGLVWVGGQRKPTEDVDAPSLVKSLRELAARVQVDRPEVVHDGRRAQFKRKSAERLTVYRDGFCLRNGPFRPFDNASTFVRDVLDGYFPAEFKAAYPDGVPFDVVDRSSEAYAEAFGGAGKPLGHTGQSVRDDVTLGRNELLGRLPDTVIRDGHVLKIREGVRDRIEGPAQGQAPTTTYTAEVADIQVRDLDGTRLVVSMRRDATVGDLRAEIDKARLPSKNTGYEIRTAFPHRAYTDPRSTLQEEGLVPSATIFLQSRTRDVPYVHT